MKIPYYDINVAVDFKTWLIGNLLIRGQTLEDWRSHRFSEKRVDIACDLLNSGVVRETGKVAKIQREILSICRPEVRHLIHDEVLSLIPHVP